MMPSDQVQSYYPVRRDWKTIAYVAFLAMSFWFLRIYYWRTTSEAPFSDMADYIHVAHQIKDHFFFAHSENLYSYFTPVTPSLLAISLAISEVHFLLVFRTLVQLIAFTGVLLLAYGIVTYTGRQLLGAAIFFAVAFSRPSIFWSLKPSTETVSEALLILSIALCLRGYRTKNMLWALFSGICCMLLALNRPQFLLSVIGVAFLIFLSAVVSMGRGTSSSLNGPAPPGSRFFSNFRMSLRSYKRSRPLIFAAVFVTGVSVIWAPWIVRSYVHYRAIIPTGTSGMDSLIFDYAGAPVRAGDYSELKYGNGQILRDFDFRKIRDGIYSRGTDFEAYKAEREIFVAWLQENWNYFPRLFFWRLKSLIAERGPNGLSHVSREVLFPTDVAGWNYSFSPKSWLDLALIDKSPMLMFLGFAGVALFIIRYGLPGWLLASLVVLPWITVAMVFGYERAVESMVSTNLWLAAYFTYEIIMRHQRPAPSTINA